MIFFQDYRYRKCKNYPPDSVIYVNLNEIKVNKEVCKTISAKLKNIFSRRVEPSKRDKSFFLKILLDNPDYAIIENLFTGKKIEIEESKIKLYQVIGDYFEITSLSLFKLFII